MGGAEFRTARGYELIERRIKGLTPSMEDYIEMIYRLGRDGIRTNDLAEALNVKPSSVSKMIQRLDASFLVTYEKYAEIRLTEKGHELGEFLYFRHNVLGEFLGLLGVKKNLLKEIEMMEHNISGETLDCIITFVCNVKRKPGLWKNLCNK